MLPCLAHPNLERLWVMGKRWETLRKLPDLAAALHIASQRHAAPLRSRAPSCGRGSSPSDRIRRAATELPRCARPPFLPLNCLRNLVRFLVAEQWSLMRKLPGAMVASTGQRPRARPSCVSGRGAWSCWGENFALEDPHLHADDAIGGLRLRPVRSHIGTEDAQRHTSPFR